MCKHFKRFGAGEIINTWQHSVRLSMLVIYPNARVVAGPWGLYEGRSGAWVPTCDGDRIAVARQGSGE